MKAGYCIQATGLNQAAQTCVDKPIPSPLVLVQAAPWVPLGPAHLVLHDQHPWASRHALMLSQGKGPHLWPHPLPINGGPGSPDEAKRQLHSLACRGGPACMGALRVQACPGSGGSAGTCSVLGETMHGGPTASREGHAA